MTPPPSDQIWLKIRGRGGVMNNILARAPKKIAEKLTVSPLETAKKCQNFPSAAGFSESGQVSENKGGHPLRGGHPLQIPLMS